MIPVNNFEDLRGLIHGLEVDNPSRGVHGVIGDVVGTTDAQTLSNKTIIDSGFSLVHISDKTKVIRFSIDNISPFTSKTIRFPNSSTMLVGDDSIQTLTNKSMGDSLNLSSNKVINMLDPTLDQDASTKKYVDDSIDITRTYVDDSISVTRTYVDDSISAIPDPSISAFEATLTVDNHILTTSWATIPGMVLLITPGTWLVFRNIRMQVSATTNYVVSRLVIISPYKVIWQSELICGLTTASGLSNLQLNGSGVKIVTVTQDAAIEVQAYRAGGTGTAYIRSSSTGRSYITAIKLSN